MKNRIITATIFIILLTASSLFAKTTVSWWQFWTDPVIKPVIQEIVAEFEKQNPDITIELTDLTWANGHEKIVIAFASGTGPDIVELGSDWIAEFASNDLLWDLSQQITADSAQFQGWSMATYKDKVYAYPWILGTRVIFGNKDLIKKAGYDEDYAPVKMSELKEAAIKINGLGKDIYGWGSNTPEKHRLYKKYLPFFWSAGAQFFTDDNRYCIIASDKAISALQFYKDLHDSCGYVADQRGIEDAFLDGKIGFIMSGDWLLKRIENEKRTINLMSTLIPGQNFPGKSFLGGEFLSINNNSENKEASLKFIKFITTPENQLKFCIANRSANPSSIKAQQNEYFNNNINLQTFIKQMRLAKHPPVDPDWVFMEEIIEKAVEKSLFENGLVAEPLLEAQNEITELKKNKK